MNNADDEIVYVVMPLQHHIRFAIAVHIADHRERRLLCGEMVFADNRGQVLVLAPDDKVRVSAQQRPPHGGRQHQGIFAALLDNDRQLIFGRHRQHAAQQQQRDRYATMHQVPQVLPLLIAIHNRHT